MEVNMVEFIKTTDQYPQQQKLCVISVTFLCLMKIVDEFKDKLGWF